MSKEKRILLLDIDGVLLQPGGYRQAVTATINYFTSLSGLTDLAPEEEVLAFFESRGITNEWDIVPICLSTIFETMLEEYSEIALPSDWPSAAAKINVGKVKIKKVDYRKKILEISKYLSVGKSPSAVIFEAGQNGPGNELFPLFCKHPLFTTLLNDNKDIEKSLTTKIFQNYVLGSKLFQEIYNLEPLIITQSSLSQFDYSNLSESNCRAILRFSNEGMLSPVAFTARPSLPPKGIETSIEGYSPEAELALELVGLPEIPLIAYGRLRFAAQLFQISPDLLIKPSPFQALAAICVAAMSNKDEEKALIFAGKICAAVGLFPDWDGHSPAAIIFEPPVSDFLTELRSCHLVIDIIEDSPIGLSAAKRACQIISDLNISVEFHHWGVTQDNIKKMALEAEGAAVYGNINEIIPIILEKLHPLLP